MIDVKYKIKSQDLRIGNWVSNSEKEYTVDINMLCDLCESEFNNGYYELFPIQLTRDLLFKRGFMQVNNNFILPNGFTIKNVLTEYSDEIGLRVHANSFIVYVRFPINPFQYLHQLQNIYYDLMQAELP